MISHAQRYSPARTRATARHHLEIVEAIRAGDCDWSESAMRTHILSAKTTVQQSIEDVETVD